MHRRWFDCLVIGVAALVSLFAVVAFTFAPRHPEAGVGVVFAPWVSETDALARATGAGARLVRFAGLPFILVVMPETEDYAARVSAAGALFLVDPLALAACLTLSPKSFTGTVPQS